MKSNAEVFITRTVKIISQVWRIIRSDVLVHKVRNKESLKCQEETNSVAHIRQSRSQDNCTSLSPPIQAEEASVASWLTWQ